MYKNPESDRGKILFLNTDIVPGMKEDIFWQVENSAYLTTCPNFEG